MSSNDEDDLRSDQDKDEPPAQSKLEATPTHTGLYQYLREREVKISDTEKQCEEYAAKLSDIKARARESVRSPRLDSPVERLTGNDSPSKETRAAQRSERQAPASKSLMLLRQKTSENRAIFEQRGRELSENKKGLEMRLEHLQVQLNERDSTIRDLLESKPAAAASPSRSHTPVLQAAQFVPIPQQVVGSEEALREKDQELCALRERVFELEAIVIGLQENLVEKDSVIDARTKAITLMSEDLCRKGKSTLDQLEDTKEQMRIMQCNFVAHEADMKQEKEELNMQLAERDKRLYELEEIKAKLEAELNDLDNRVFPTHDSTGELAEANNELILLRSEVSDSCAKLTELTNRIAELEEEKGNLQLQMVDFDDLKDLCEHQQAHLNRSSPVEVVEQNLKSHVEHLEHQLSQMEELKVKSELRAVQLEEDIDKLTLQLSPEVNQDHDDNKLNDMPESKKNADDQLDGLLIAKIAYLDEIETQLASVLGGGSFDYWMQQIVELKIKVSHLQNTVLEYEDKSLAQEGVRCELESNIANVAEKTLVINDLSDKLSKCQAELRSRDVELQAATSSQPKLNEKMKKVLANLKVRNAEVKDLKLKVNHLDSIIEQRDLAIAKLESNEGAAYEWKQTMEEGRKKLEEDNVYNMELLKKVQVQAENLQDELNQALDTLKKEESRRCKVEKEFSLFRAQQADDVQVATQSILLLNNQISMSEERNHVLTDELTTKTEAFNALQNEIEDIKALSDSTVAELNSIIDNLQYSITNKERDSENQISKLKSRIDELDWHCKSQDGVVNDLTMTQELLAESQQAYVELEVKIQEQTDTMEALRATSVDQDIMYRLEQSLIEQTQVVEALESKYNQTTAELSSINERYVRDIGEAKTKYDEQVAYVEASSQEVNSLLDQIHQLKLEASQDQEGLRQSAMVEIDKVTAAKEVLAAENVVCKDKIHHLEQSLQELSQIIEASATKYNKTAAELSSINERYLREMEEAKTKHDEHAHFVEIFSEELHGYLSQIQQLKFEANQDQDWLRRAASAEINKETTAKEALAAENILHKEQIQHLEQALWERDGMIQASETIYNKQVASIEELSTELKNYQDKIHNLEISLSEQVEVHKYQLQNSEALISQLAEKEAIVSDADELQIKLVSLKEANEEYCSLVYDLQTQIAKLLNSNEQSTEEIKRLRDDLLVYEQNFNVVAGELQRSNDNLKEVHSQYEQCENDRCELVTKAEELLLEKSSVESNLHEATINFKNLISRTEELETELFDAKSRLEKSEKFSAAFRVQEEHINDKLNNTLKLLTQYSSEMEAIWAVKEGTIMESMQRLQDEQRNHIALLTSEHQTQVSALVHENSELVEQLNTLRSSMPTFVDMLGKEGSTVVTADAGLQTVDPSDPWIETEEGWGWGTDEAKLEEQHQVTQQLRQTTPPVDSHLRQQLVELELTVEELELERSKLAGELRTAQVRSGKLLKQLKDMKAKELSASKPDRLTSLDQAMETEFTHRISTLENDVAALNELKDIITIENQRLKNHVDSLEWQISELKDDKSKLSAMLVESRRTPVHDNLMSTETKEAEERTVLKEIVVNLEGAADTEDRSNVDSSSNLLGDSIPCGDELPGAQQFEVEFVRNLCKDLTDKLSERELKMSELDKALLMQSSETERLSSALTATKVDLANLCQVYEQLSSVYQNTLAELERVQSVLKITESSVSDEGTQISHEGSHEANDEYVRQMHNTLLSRENEMQLMKIKYSTDFEKTLAEIENLKENLMVKDKQILWQYEEISNLKEDLSNQMSEMKQLHEHLNTASQRGSDLEEDLTAQDEEAETYKARLESMTKELKEQRNVIQLLKSVHSSSQDANDAKAKEDIREQEESNSELDTALYLLHQKEVRCDEMTLELVQLLEERDTLQLRLSTSLRENMELSRSLSATSATPAGLSTGTESASLVRDQSPADTTAPPPSEPLANGSDSSPSRTRILEDKLIQVRSVSREQRQRALQQQQRGSGTVDANFTLSRDVQSQPETFMNWLWGKSTPKVTDI